MTHDEDLFNDGLFTEPPLDHIQRGQEVVAHLIWGDETVVVEDIGTDVDGWPMVRVKTKTGQRITVARSSVGEKP